jgi:hypothetical protein
VKYGKLHLPELACWHVHAGNIHEAAELAVVMVLQEGQDRNHARWSNQNLQLVA